MNQIIQFKTIRPAHLLCLVLAQYNTSAQKWNRITVSKRGVLAGLFILGKWMLKAVLINR